MTPRRVLVIALAIAGARTAAAGPLVGEPEVRILELARDTAGAGQTTVRNTGATAVTVTAVVRTAGCADEVSVPAAGFALAPGAARTLAFSCEAAPPAMRRCTFELRGATGALGDFEVVCASAGTAALTGPASLDLGATAVGTTTSRTLTLHNSGAAIARAFLGVTDHDFSLAAPCNPDAHECDAGVTVPAGGDLAVTVNCTPRSAAAHAAELHVTTSGGARLAAPVALSCTGTAAGRPVLTARPAVIDAGTVDLVGATATATVHLGNAGTASVTVRDIQIADDGTGGAADWRVDTTCALPTCAIGPTDAVDLALTFDPGAIGVRDATLILSYHDIADRSLTIPLRGVGSGPAFELATPVPGVDFGTLPLNHLATLPLTVINRGSVALDDARVTLVPPVAAFSASLSPISIPAGGTATLNVSCQLAAAGSATTTLHLEAPDAVTPAADVPLHCAADNVPAFANPPALQLGELRLGPTTTAMVQLQSVGAPVAIGPATLVTADPRIELVLSAATTPATLTARVSAATAGPLTNQILVSPSPLSLAVTGSVVTPDFDAADVVSLGTFCVDQPTTPRILAFTATGTATLALTATPALQHAGSPFDLQLVAPLTYPASIAPGARAVIAVTPRRQATAGLVSDAVRWTTDVTGHTAVTTQINASFVDDGGAIAPSALVFPATPIHLDTSAPQQVTLQNCSTSPLELGAPQIEAPFSIDSPNFPSVVAPGELATFSVGFHPTQVGPATKTLTLTSPQLPDAPLTVALFGAGIAGSDPDGSNAPGDRGSPKSFYACDRCASASPSSALALLAALLVLRRRRVA